MSKTLRKKRFSMDKLTPYFQKISSFSYLRAVRDGFISAMPLILFSSLFLLVAFVPNIFNYYLPHRVEWMLVRSWELTMGILSMFVAAGTAKSLMEHKNQQLGVDRQVPIFQVQTAAIVAFFMLAATPISMNTWNNQFNIGQFGTSGLLVAFISGFIIPNIYYVFFKYNLTIKLPSAVPSNIAQVFLVLFPFAISTIVFWLWGWTWYTQLGISFVGWFMNLFRPIFEASDSPGGLVLIFGAMAFFWFIGIHGPSIVEPIVTAVYLQNVDTNFHSWSNGGHADKILSQGSQYFVATLGGTGATLMITILFAILAKSKTLKSVGRSSLLPVFFGVNEPILFGAPLVLNPIYLIPFILTPIVNVLLFWFFIKVLSMNGFIYNLPWTTPGLIGLGLGTGVSEWRAWVLGIILMAVDGVIYFPFFKYHDRQEVKNEAKSNNKVNEENTVLSTTKSKLKKDSIKKDSIKKDSIKKESINVNKTTSINVLVICANGATSGMLADSIKKGSKKTNASITSLALPWGQHIDALPKFDVVILAPQMISFAEKLKEQIKNDKTIIMTPKGTEYIKYVNNPEDAINWLQGARHEKV